MKRKNCWQFFDCGRELGGCNVDKQGVCTVAIPSEFDGVNKGTYAGRFCWAITGTYRHGGPTCTYALKLLDCLNCDFMKQVIFKEGDKFILSPADAKKHIKAKRDEKIRKKNSLQ